MQRVERKNSRGPLYDATGDQADTGLQVNALGELRVVEEVQPLTAIAHTEVDVGQVSTLIVAANPNRRYLLLVNRGDYRVDLKWGGEAVSGEGIPLVPADGDGEPLGSYEMALGGKNIYQGAIYGIIAGGVIAPTPTPTPTPGPTARVSVIEGV